MSKSWKSFFPHKNNCNVGTNKLYLVGEIEQHRQEKYELVLIITII